MPFDNPFSADYFEKGGPGSGNFDHAGRPGEIGGSASGDPITRYLSQDRLKDFKVIEHIKKEDINLVIGQIKTFAGPDDYVYSYGEFGGIKYEAKLFIPVNGNKFWSFKVGESQLDEAGILQKLKTKLTAIYRDAEDKRYGVQKGGPGSGNFGHAGRPGERGGSAPSDESAGTVSTKSPKSEKPSVHKNFVLTKDEEAKIRLAAKHKAQLIYNRLFANRPQEEIDKLTGKIVTDRSDDYWRKQRKSISVEIANFMFGNENSADQADRNGALALLDDSPKSGADVVITDDNGESDRVNRDESYHWGSMGSDWNRDSSSNTSDAMKYLAAEEHGGTVFTFNDEAGTEGDHTDDLSHKAHVYEQLKKQTGMTPERVKKFMDIEAILNQEIARRIFGDQITLYRGVKTKGSFDLKEGDQKSQLNALSSWSFSKEKAMNFALKTRPEESEGYLMKIKVPVEKLFSSWLGNFGTDYESEAVIYGGEVKTNIKRVF